MAQEKLNNLYERWKALQPLLTEAQQSSLSRRFTIEYNYNSNHIEGNTLTYGQTELLLMFGTVSGEGHLHDFSEMKASQVGLEMMSQAVKEGNMPVTQHFIRTLHKTILREDYTVYRNLPGGQHTSYVIHAGQYKTRPNSVITRYGDRFEYASPEETPALMTDLVNWYNEAEASGKYTVVELAALFHYRYIRIHPFEDGNGRILVEEELTYNIEFIENKDASVWWYDGEKIAFRSPNASKILGILKDNPYITFAKLSEEVGINVSAIQKLLDGMQEKGYIQRRDSDKSWYVLASSVL